MVLADPVAREIELAVEVVDQRHAAPGRLLALEADLSTPRAADRPRAVHLEIASDPERDAVQPAADRVLLLNRDGLPVEHQERGLAGVFGVVQVLQHAAAHAQDYRPVPPDQRREGPSSWQARKRSSNFQSDRS
ncbi:MAG TPA: hypothetical protein VH643_12585 [Gemmataceae bacterium]